MSEKDLYIEVWGRIKEEGIKNFLKKVFVGEWERGGWEEIYKIVLEVGKS